MKKGRVKIFMNLTCQLKPNDNVLKGEALSTHILRRLNVCCLGHIQSRSVRFLHDLWIWLVTAVTVSTSDKNSTRHVPPFTTIPRW